MSAAHSDGLPGPIGEVFGAFEPRFYGISFLLETPAMFEAWMASAGLFPDKAPKRLPLFEQTCLETALEHETRHFHDALISPFANAILMLRLQAAFNGLKVFNRSLRSGANCLPVPVAAWVAKPPVERTAWLAELEADPPPGLSVPLRPVPLPHIPGGAMMLDKPVGRSEVPPGDIEAEIATFAQASLGAYRRAADLMRGPSVLLETNEQLRALPDAQKRQVEATMTPRNLFEASALAVQAQAAWTNIGAQAAQALLAYLSEAEIGYAQVFRKIVRAATSPGRVAMVAPERIAAVAVWCLLGDPAVRDDFDPSIRMTRVLRLLGGEGFPDDVPVGDLWDQWDARLGLKGWRENITGMRARTGRSAAIYAKVAPEDGEPAAAFATVLEAYAADQAAATDLLLADPDSYVNTLRYTKETSTRLPTPMISVECGEFVVPLDAFPPSDRVRLPRTIDDGKTRGWNRSVIDRAEPARARLLDAVLELEFLCKMVDVAFSEDAVRGIDRDVLIQSIEAASGQKLLLVF